MHRLAIVASHPIQYHAPWYRALTRFVDLHVFYAHRTTPEQQADAGFNVAFEWDIPLLEGHSYSFLRNRARHPSTSRFFGCDTPDIGDAIRSGRFDAVLVNGWNLRSYWQAVRAARSAGIPVMVRGDSRLSSRQSAAVRVAKGWVYPAMLRRFDAFLAVGKRNTEYLQHYGAPPNRIFRVPHCVDNDFFARNAAAARKAGTARQHFGLRAGATVFLFAGKFVEFKRPADVLAAAGTSAGVQVLMVGDGPLRSSLEAFAREHGVPAIFAGFLNQREIAVAFAAADVLIVPSDERETWGLIANEAMAAGLPLLASNAVGCAPDLIVEGQTGFTYPCGDVERLRQHLRHLAADRGLIGKMSDAAVQHIANYSFPATIDGVLAALDFVISSRFPPSAPMRAAPEKVVTTTTRNVPR